VHKNRLITALSPTPTPRRNSRTERAAGGRVGSIRRAAAAAQINPGTPTTMNAMRQP
jgi:hypothetical protein